MKNGGQIESGLRDGTWRVRYKISGEPQVSIIIPSGGNTRNLRKNLDSIFDLTAYPNYEVVIIDNSHGDEVHKLTSLYSRAPFLRALYRLEESPLQFFGNQQPCRASVHVAVIALPE